MRFGTGVALGFGLGGINDANIDVQLDTIGGASFRWDTVVLRLNRSAKTAVVTKVKATDNTEAIVTASDGAASLVFPSGCKFTESDRDAGEWDVPLAMGKVTSTSANLAQLLDIRPHANLWPHTFADPPLAWWGYGALVTLDRTNGVYDVWQRRGSNWVNLTNPPPIAAPALAWQVSSGGNGWANNNNGTVLRVKPSEYVAQVRFKRVGSSIPIGANGNVADTYVVGLPSPIRSDIGAAGAGYVNVPGVGSYGMIWRFDSDGKFWVVASTNPNVTWPAGTTFAADVHIPR
jgi:hypothetical protein